MTPKGRQSPFAQSQLNHFISTDIKLEIVSITKKPKRIKIKIAILLILQKLKKNKIGHRNLFVLPEHAKVKL